MYQNWIRCGVGKYEGVRAIDGNVEDDDGPLNGGLSRTMKRCVAQNVGIASMPEVRALRGSEYGPCSRIWRIPAIPQSSRRGTIIRTEVLIVDVAAQRCPA